jgi:hypothetical protein
MSNPNQQITITLKEKRALEGKAKQGWKCYFIERDANFELGQAYHAHAQTAQQLRNGQAVDITHLTKMFLDLYDKVGELVSCPVCLEQMVKDNTHLPVCGHLICKGCKANPAVNKCPICRKDY